MKTTALFVATAVAAAAATNVTHCTEADYQKVQAASETWTSWNFMWCKGDLGLTTEQFNNQNTTLTVKQAQTFATSSSCQKFYGNLQKNAAKQNCLELNLLQNVSWSMVSSLMSMEAVPKVNTTCSKMDLARGFGNLAVNPNSFSCLGASIKDAFRQLPNAKQVANFRANPSCASVFASLQTIVGQMPHCSIDGNGTDIHVLQNITWNTTLDWLDFVNSIPVDATAATTFAFKYMPQTHAANSMIVACGAMIAGAVVVLVAVTIYNARKVTRRDEERTTLLRV
ncbi:Aste57867_1194 [Aphanomyces stellatus]|uniref:Aste57867_1194 protein n=1 Tax=Aphanomyces stellatus TaxID=120398 RepID=A0A485K7A2_9STRA|nr:hypothetical protein As57867_001193 [Aphanomyces stellatus]VFT78414.1 Aste57867_1194 [Aphanomyces stellatus]